MIEIVQSSVSDLRKANKAEMAEWFCVSVATIDAWLRRGCPHIQRGNRGLSWVFDLRAVAEWYYGGKATNAPEEDPEKMSPKDRLDWYKGARERTKHMEECGELIPAADYERALSDALKVVAMGLESLPDVLERDTGMSGEAVERAQQVIDGLREELHKRLTSDA